MYSDENFYDPSKNVWGGKMGWVIKRSRDNFNHMHLDFYCVVNVIICALYEILFNDAINMVSMIMAFAVSMWDPHAIIFCH